MHRIILQIGPFTLYSYGLLVATAVFLAVTLIIRQARKRELEINSVMDCLLSVIAGGIIGGRLLFVFINFEHYLREPLRIFMIYEGGLAFQGALAGGVIAGMIAVRLKKINFWIMADLTAPYVALAQAVGRIGCFFNGCCYGRVIEKGFGVVFPGENVLRIPTQLYSSFSLFVIFLILITIRKMKRYDDGYLAGMYLILYSIFRFFLDFLRGDDSLLFFGIRLSQVISIGLFLSGSVVFLILKRKNGIKKNSR
ncbi:MAG: prolipoprotein diacylglyceryl transferase [Candidatus Omnitrophota bacterium]